MALKREAHRFARAEAASRSDQIGRQLSFRKKATSRIEPQTLNVLRGARANLRPEATREIPGTYRGSRGELFDRKVLVEVFNHPTQERRYAIGCPLFDLDHQVIAELRLSSRTFQIDDELTCRRQSGCTTQIAFHKGKRQIDACRAARRRVKFSIRHIDRIGINPD